MELPESAGGVLAEERIPERQFESMCPVERPVEPEE